METVYDKAQKLNSKNFKLLIGVKKETFQLMLEHLNSAYQIQHRKGGRPRSLPMEDQLIMTLRYLRYYPTQRLLAFDFGVGVATVNAIITWVEDTLRASGSFDLDHLEAPSAAVAIDVTESPIQRPKKTTAIFFRYGLTVENKTLFCETNFLAREGACSGERYCRFL
ncbi:transposase [Streptococcus pneumoniae]|nr:transposase [Streptococcus pneumoniae]